MANSQEASRKIASQFEVLGQDLNCAGERGIGNGIVVRSNRMLRHLPLFSRQNYGHHSLGNPE